MKNNSLFKFLVLVVVGLILIVTSCKDYDDDISDLQEQITSLKATVDAINSAIQAGVVIKEVRETTNGIIITLSNNQSYTIKNGTDGRDGANGSVLTIGENGNWFINGVDTKKTSKGADGTPGEEGEDGKDGAWYYPKADGFWYKVEDGNETKTDQTWLPEGTITAILENGNVTLYNVEGADGPIILGQATLSYLTIIPDYISGKDGTPIVNFATLVTECGEISPQTNLRLQVSPSNASEELIDVEKIYFKYNNPTVTTRSSEINPKATFISLEEGILTVKVDINIEATEKEGSDKIDQIMLMVPLKSGGEINSNWATVTASPSNYEDLALVRSPKADDSPWADMALTQTLEATKLLAKTDPRVLEMKYSETVDLADVVRTMFTQGEWSNFNIDTYNLEIAIDLNDGNGATIVNEVGDTDQQQFIKVEGSKVTSLVYEIEGLNPSAADRNPIVRVMLESKEATVGCDIMQGFIKLNLVEDDVIPTPPVDFTAEEPLMAGCQAFTMTIDADRMEESFYTLVTREVFHDSYTWSVSSEGTGTIEEVEDPGNAGYYNLTWTVSVDELWDNLSTTIEKTGYYTHNGSMIRVTFSAEVEQPAADLAGLLLEEVWAGNGTSIIHNVATPEMNLNEAFTMTADKLLDLASANTAYAGYSYEYLFDANQPLTTVDDITISVSNDGKQLLANGETVATIKLQVVGTGDILAFNDESALAGVLLDKGILQTRIKLVVANECDRPVLVDAFNGGDSFLVYLEEDMEPVNIIVNGSFEDDFEPAKKPASPIFAQTIGIAEPARVAKYFNSMTEPHFPIISEPDRPTFETENGIWYLSRTDSWSYTRIYIDALKETTYGDNVLTIHNTGASHNTQAARAESGHNPFNEVLIQRVNMNNNWTYTLNFSYLKVGELLGGSNSRTGNHVTRFVVGIVASTDDTSTATYSVDAPIPSDGDETWKDLEVTFDLPALIAANPQLDFTTAAIIFGIQTKEDPNSSNRYSMLPGQMSIDNISLMRKK